MRSSRNEAMLLALAPLLALAACAGGDDAGVQGAGPGTSLPGSMQPGSMQPGSTQPGSMQPGSGAGVTTLPPPDPAAGVSNYDRPLGMPIGQAPDPEGEEGVDDFPLTPGDDVEASEDIDIPVFVPMEDGPPCAGCVELNVDVNDINQRDNFVFGANNVNVTRVVWNIIIPFNSDQLFIQPFVNNSYGTFTDLDANAFTVGTPVQLVHQYSGPAMTVGLAVGSSGAWTGNMTMAIFVDSVTLEGADASASRTFDTDLQGLVVGSNAHNPKIVHHP